MKRTKIVIIFLGIIIVFIVGAILLKVKINKDKNVEVQLSYYKKPDISYSVDENFIYDHTTDLDYDKLKYHVFAQASIEELNKNYPIKYLKERNNIYYTLYSLKDNKLCYIVFKEIDGNLYIDFSWVYSNDMVDSDKILSIENGTNYNILDSIDKNSIKIDELSSTYFTLHFFKNGTSAMLEVDSNGNICKKTINNNNIFNIIYNNDYPEKYKLQKENKKTNLYYNLEKENKNYKLYTDQSGLNYFYEIYNNSGECIDIGFHTREVSFELIDNILSVKMGFGTYTIACKYYDLSSNRVSRYYNTPLKIGGEYIAYFKEIINNNKNEIILVVQNIFDERIYYKEIKRDFSSEVLRAYSETNFINDNTQLEISYPTNSNGEIIKEVIDI